MNSVPSPSFQEFRVKIGYPDVPMPNPRSWDKIPFDYRSVEYIAKSVKETVPDWDNQNLDEVYERAQRLTLTDGPIRRDNTGRPLNPAGATGISGFGRLRNLGPNLTADGLVVHGDNVLIIERRDTGQLAFPGGFLDPDAYGTYEDAKDAAIREVQEETSIDLRPLILGQKATPLFKGVAELSLRNTDNAWIENTALFFSLDPSSPLPTPEGGDDARAARWLPLATLALSRMSDSHSKYANSLAAKLGIRISASQ